MTIITSVRQVLIKIYIYIYIQGVSGRIVNILGGGSMENSEEISSYKHVSNFHWVRRYSCLKLARTDQILSVGMDEKRSLQRKSKHKRGIGRSHYA